MVGKQSKLGGHHIGVGNVESAVGDRAVESGSEAIIVSQFGGGDFGGDFHRLEVEGGAEGAKTVLSFGDGVNQTSVEGAELAGLDAGGVLPADSGDRSEAEVDGLTEGLGVRGVAGGEPREEYSQTDNSADADDKGDAHSGVVKEGAFRRSGAWV